jgi:hypothetical protein
MVARESSCYANHRMTVLIEMPVAIYQAFLGRYSLSSREYEVLKTPSLAYATDRIHG